jgi:exonuclease VII large subunit
MARGFSVTTREGSSAPLLDAASVAAGERVVTRLGKGRFVSVVEP